MESSPLTAPTTLDYPRSSTVVRPVKYSSPPATRLGRTEVAVSSRSTPAISNLVHSARRHHSISSAPSLPHAEFGLSLPPAVARKSHSDDFYIRPRSELQFHRPVVRSLTPTVSEESVPPA